MNFAAFETAIAAAVLAASGLTGQAAQNAVEWRGKPKAGAYRPDTRVELDLRGPLRSFGPDFERRTDNDGGADQTVALVGDREFGVEVRVEAPSGSLADSAQALASRIATRLGRASNLQTVRAAGLALRDVGAVTPVRMKLDGRDYSAAVFELRFGAVEYDVDDTNGVGEYADSAQATSDQITGPDGVAITPQLEVNAP